MSYHHHSRASSLLPTESHHSSGFTPSMQRLMDKQREYEAFYKIHQQSQQLLDFLSQFSDQYMVLDGGSEAVGDVVEHWQTAFRATHLALSKVDSSRTSFPIPSSEKPLTPKTIKHFPSLHTASLGQQCKEAEANETSTHNLLPERLVRIPVATPNEVDDPAAASYDPAESSS